MNAFQKLNFKLLVDPIDQGLLFRARQKQAEGPMRLKAYYVYKAGPSHNLKKVISVNVFKIYRK